MDDSGASKVGRLAGKVAVITGAGSGIGLATALLFSREGASVVLAGRNEAALQEAAASCPGSICQVTDVTRPEDNERLVNAAFMRHGRIDAFFINAGAEGVAAPITDYPVDVFDQVMAVNVRGVFLGLKSALTAMRATGGSIIVTSSIGGIKARGQGNSAYIASKHAEVGLMRTASVEGAPFNIRVNCVLPGPIETRMIRNIEESRSPGAPEKARATLVGGLPFKRYGTAEEVANLVLFLASDESSYCTGGLYGVDGGLSAL
jgi:NAD(P)-dependent dehydrogenase (short-subunit alcohol dehydrogenase family)